MPPIWRGATQAPVPPSRSTPPGTTSTAVLERLAEAGATQVEPGHGLTGTTPLHAAGDLPEVPAICYLSEVSHLHGGVPLCFGGGFYVDPVFEPYSPEALVAADPSDLTEAPVAMDFPDPAGIDYYARLHPPAGRRVGEGDTRDLRVPGAGVRDAGVRGRTLRRRGRRPRRLRASGTRSAGRRSGGCDGRPRRSRPPRPASRAPDPAAQRGIR